MCHGGGARDVVDLGAAGEDDPDRARMQAAHVAEQLGAVHARHPHVGHDDVELLAGHSLERRRAAGRELHLPLAPAGTQHVPQALEQLDLVVDEQDPPHAAAASMSEPPIGRRTWNVVPKPGSVSNAIVPP